MHNPFNYNYIHPTSSSFNPPIHEPMGDRNGASKTHGAFVSGEVLWRTDERTRLLKAADGPMQSIV